MHSARFGWRVGIWEIEAGIAVAGLPSLVVRRERFDGWLPIWNMAALRASKVQGQPSQVQTNRLV